MIQESSSKAAGIELIDDHNVTTLYPYLEILIRGNLIRHVGDVADSLAIGIYFIKVENALVQENVIDAAVGRPIVQNNAGALEYLDNETSSGVLRQGFDEVTLLTIDELSTKLEDVNLLSI